MVKKSLGFQRLRRRCCASTPPSRTDNTLGILVVVCHARMNPYPSFGRYLNSYLHRLDLMDLTAERFAKLILSTNGRRIIERSRENRGDQRNGVRYRLMLKVPG